MNTQSQVVSTHLEHTLKLHMSAIMLTSIIALMFIII